MGLEKLAYSDKTALSVTRKLFNVTMSRQMDPVRRSAVLKS